MNRTTFPIQQQETSLDFSHLLSNCTIPYASVFYKRVDQSWS